MKIPKAKKLKSGTWYIQLRLDGQSIYITAPTEKECVRKAELIKAEHRSGLRETQTDKDDPTLSEAITLYLEDKSAVLSPETRRKYINIQKNHWPELMNRRITRITPNPSASSTCRSDSVCSSQSLLIVFTTAYPPSLISCKEGRPPFPITTAQSPKILLFVPFRLDNR